MSQNSLTDSRVKLLYGDQENPFISSLIGKKWQFAFVKGETSVTQGKLFWLAPKTGYDLPILNWQQAARTKGGEVVMHPELKRYVIVFNSAGDREDFLAGNPLKAVSKLKKHYTEKALIMIRDDAQIFRSPRERQQLQERMKSSEYLEAAVGVIFPFLLSFEDFRRADRRYHEYLMDEQSDGFDRTAKLRERHLLSCVEAAIENDAVHIDNLREYAILNATFEWRQVKDETDFYLPAGVRNSHLLMKDIETTRAKIYEIDNAIRRGELPTAAGSIFTTDHNLAQNSLTGQEVALQRFSANTNREAQFRSFAPLFFKVKLKQEKERSMSNLRALKEIADRNNPGFDLTKHYLFAKREINWTLIAQASPQQEIVRVLAAGEEFRALTEGTARRQLPQGSRDNQDSGNNA
jgi:hypothetical protein